MDSFGIIPVHILFNAIMEFFIGGEFMVVQLFIFNTLKEAFCHSTIPTVCLSAHRGPGMLVQCQNITKPATHVLTPRSECNKNPEWIPLLHLACAQAATTVFSAVRSRLRLQPTTALSARSSIMVK